MKKIVTTEKTVVTYGRKIFEIFFLGGLILLPLIYWPWAAIPFEVPKVYFFNRWVEILALLGLTTSFNSLEKDKSDNKLLYLVGIFFIITVISSVFGSDWQKSVLGNYYRGDGLVTLAHLVGLFLLTLLFFKKDWVTQLLAAISLGAVLTSIWVTFYDAFKLFVLNISTTPNWNGALGATFGNPNFLAGYLVVSLPATAYFLRFFPNKWKYVAYTGLFTQISAIFLTRAVAGILGIFLFSMLSTVFKKTKIKRLIFLVASLIFISVSLIFIYNFQRQDSVGLVAEGRERIIKKGFLAFKERPLLGWGWANFDYAFDAVVWPIKLGNDVYVDKAHSLFLEVLVTTGIVGFTFYLALISTGFLNLLKNRSLRNPLLYIFVLFLLHSQTNVISIAEEAIFWIILGVSAKIPAKL